MRLPNKRGALAIAFGLALSACGSASTVSAPAATAASSTTTTTEPVTSTTTTEVVETTIEAPATVEPLEGTTVAPTTVAPETTTTSTTTQAPSTTTAAAPLGEAFGATIFEINDIIAGRMERSWREGCPVPLSELRFITLNHWDYDGDIASGELVVNAAHADGIVQVFSRLFDAQFPIERMELVDNFEADDDLSMVANNTSGFNCRNVAGTDRWSNHAFGEAVDINPLVNPWVTNTGVFPPEGTPFIDRSVQVQGGIYAGDVVTQAFAEIGWEWGGDWVNSKDWQHFDAG